MKLSRYDSYLLAGLSAALLVVFVRPVSHLLEVAREVEREHGLSLVPGLIILIFVFLFQQQAKRQETREQAAEARVQAREAIARATEMERLVSYGQALARSLDLVSIRDASIRDLPRLAGEDDVWVLLLVRGQWRPLVGEATDGSVSRQREQAADRALKDGGKDVPSQGLEDGGVLCLPLVAGGATVGVLGVADSRSVSEGQRRTLAAASALLAVSIRNAMLFQEVRENSLRDALTGCYNRTHMLELLDVEMRRSRRTKLPLSLIMFDLDHFKQINDRLGHQCGDAVLSAVGRRMKELLRTSDLRGRYGGEEFMVLLTETPAEGATRVAESLRRGLRDTDVHWDGRIVSVTASFGVATAVPGEMDTAAFVSRADAALYQAKREGRDCVRVASLQEAVPERHAVPENVVQPRATTEAAPSPVPETTAIRTSSSQ
jgi:diguanylate cyclase (GGDEF)-like protein